MYQQRLIPTLAKFMEMLWAGLPTVDGLQHGSNNLQSHHTPTEPTPSTPETHIGRPVFTGGACSRPGGDLLRTTTGSPGVLEETLEQLALLLMRRRSSQLEVWVGMEQGTASSDVWNLLRSGGSEESPASCPSLTYLTVGRSEPFMCKKCYCRTTNHPLWSDNRRQNSHKH